MHFVSSLPEDPAMALIGMLEMLQKIPDNAPRTLFELTAAVRAFVLHHEQALGVKIELPHVNREDYGPSRERILDFALKTTAALREKAGADEYNNMVSRYAEFFSSGFSITFSDDDIKRIQSLINTLRDEVRACQSLDDGHRKRLLRRLETLQSELHKTVSNVDQFWGFVGEATVMLRKVGEAAKPMVSRICQIMDIIQRVQCAAEGLPVMALPPYSIPELPAADNEVPGDTDED